MRLANMFLLSWLVLTISLFEIAHAQQAEGPAHVMKIVAFGTSLTARGNWPEKLGVTLQACLGEPVEVEKVARSGESTVWGLWQIDRIVALKPDIVLIELYANDAAINRLIGVGASRANYASILDQLKRGLPKARIVSLNMNPILGLKRMLRPSLPGYIAAHREETLARDLEYFDTLPAWEALDRAELARIIPDGSHPLPDDASRILVPGLVQYLTKGQCTS